MSILLFLGVSAVGGSSTTLAQDPIPPGPLGKVIQLGQTLVKETSTHPLTKPFVGNSLNCTSCHLKNGTDPVAATFIGVATAYPAWSPRENRVLTLEDRVLNCFMRSQNGIRPPLGSDVSIAITAYITWLSSGQALKMNAENALGPHAVPKLKETTLPGRISVGRELYRDRCASCHHENGSGVDDSPPVWGEKSFNDGAGLAQVPKLAAWLKVSMPLDETDLTDQEAVDVAAYVNSHSRPHFVLKEHLPGAEQMGVYNSGHRDQQK